MEICLARIIFRFQGTCRAPIGWLSLCFVSTGEIQLKDRALDDRRAVFWRPYPKSFHVSLHCVIFSSCLSSRRSLTPFSPDSSPPIEVISTYPPSRKGSLSACCGHRSYHRRILDRENGPKKRVSFHLETNPKRKRSLLPLSFPLLPAVVTPSRGVTNPTEWNDRNEHKGRQKNEKPP